MVFTVVFPFVLGYVYINVSVSDHLHTGHRDFPLFHCGTLCFFILKNEVSVDFFHRVWCYLDLSQFCL